MKNEDYHLSEESELISYISKKNIQIVRINLLVNIDILYLA